MNNYEIGDIVLWYDRKCIVTYVKESTNNYEETYEITVVGLSGQTQNVHASQIQPDLCNINKPFGLCGKFVQEALIDVHNKESGKDSNIEALYSNNTWGKRNPYFTSNYDNVFRLVKKSKVKTVTMKEVCDKFGCEVMIKDDKCPICFQRDGRHLTGCSSINGNT